MRLFIWAANQLMLMSPKALKPGPNDATMPWLAGTEMVTVGRTVGWPSSRWNVDLPTSLNCERMTASSYWVVPAPVSGSLALVAVTLALVQFVFCHIGEFV